MRRASIPVTAAIPARRSILQTTVIAAGIFVVLWVIVYFKLVTIPPLARTY